MSPMWMAVGDRRQGAFDGCTGHRPQNRCYAVSKNECQYLNLWLSWLGKTGREDYETFDRDNTEFVKTERV
jgi:hypothetical protein